MPKQLLFSLLCLLASSTAYASGAAGTAPQSVCTYPLIQTTPLSENDNYHIMVLRGFGTTLYDALDSYQRNDGLYLPVEELSSLFDLGINSAALPEGKLIITLPFTTCPIAENLQLASDGVQYYLSAANWQSLLQSKLTADYRKLRVDFSTSHQQLRPQSLSPATLNNWQTSVFTPDYITNDTYNLLNPPSFYLSLKGTKKESDEWKGRYNTIGVADVLYHSLEWNSQGETDSRSSHRLKMSRYQDGNHNAPFNLSMYEFGDIYTNRDNLIHSSGTGLGLQLRSQPSGRSAGFARIAFESNLPEGWRAELYNEGLLIDITQVGNEGRVIFDDIDLFTGANDFVLKIYGDAGEAFEFNKTINVDQEDSPKGRLNYEGFILEKGGRTIGDDDEENRGIEGKLVFNYGLSDHTSIGIGAHQLNQDDEDYHYISSSILHKWNSARLTIEGVVDDQGENAFFLGGSDQWYNVALNSEYSHFSDLIFSDLRGADNSLLTDRFRLGMSGQTFPIAGVGWRLNGRYDKLLDAEDGKNLSGTLYQGIFSGSWQHTLNYNEQAGEDDLTYQFFLTQRLGAWQLTSGLTADTQEHWTITDANVEARWQKNNRLFSTTRLSYDNDSLKTVGFSQSVTLKTRGVNFTLDTRYDHSGDWAFSSGVSFSIGYDPLTQSLSMSYLRDDQKSRIHAFAYWDKNRNQVFDKGDVGLENISFLGNYRWRELSTDRRGSVLLPGADTFEGQQISIDMSTVEDPFLVPINGKAVFNSHPGGYSTMMFPLQTMNEFEGYIYHQDGNDSRAMAGVPLVIKDLEDNEVGTTKTDIDGYYLFKNIAPGRYRLTIAEDYLLAMGLRSNQGDIPLFSSPSGARHAVPDIALSANTAAALPPPQAPLYKLNMKPIAPPLPTNTSTAQTTLSLEFLLTGGHSFINQSEANRVICQLAAYQRVPDKTLALVRDNKQLYLIKRSVNQQHWYTVVTATENESSRLKTMATNKECDAQEIQQLTQTLTKNPPWARTAGDIKAELMELPKRATDK
jgi:hypothetical protein